jgi:Cys-rich protein (TIGR01571 family)
MKGHLMSQHGINPPPKREWASGLCDCAGLCDAWLCWCNQSSRQIMAGYGHQDAMHCLWCVMLLCMNGRDQGEGGGHSIVYAAWYNRYTIKYLHNIDEGCVCTMLSSCCCPVCSIAQSYREFSAAGVFPGGVCNSENPQVTMSNPPPSLMR